MNLSWLGIWMFFCCLNAGFYIIGQHLLAIGDPLASTFGVVDTNVYNIGQDNNQTTLVGNFTTLGNYTDGGTGTPFHIFDQATEIIIQGGYTIWQGLSMGFVFSVITNSMSVMGVTDTYLSQSLAPIFGVAFVIFMGYMLLGRQPN